MAHLRLVSMTRDNVENELVLGKWCWIFDKQLAIVKKLLVRCAKFRFYDFKSYLSLHYRDGSSLKNQEVEEETH